MVAVTIILLNIITIVAIMTTYSHYHHHEDIFCGCSVGVNFTKQIHHKYKQKCKTLCG